MRITTHGTTCSADLTAEEILRLVSRVRRGIPSNAEVSVWVPGGGDWSHQQLVIGDGTDQTGPALRLTWKLPACEAVVEDVEIHGSTT